MLALPCWSLMAQQPGRKDEVTGTATEVQLVPYCSRIPLRVPMHSGVWLIQCCDCHLTLTVESSYIAGRLVGSHLAFCTAAG
jgi:hypothetical protein